MVASHTSSRSCPRHYLLSLSCHWCAHLSMWIPRSYCCALLMLVVARGAMPPPAIFFAGRIRRTSLCLPLGASFTSSSSSVARKRRFSRGFQWPGSSLVVRLSCWLSSLLRLLLFFIIIVVDCSLPSHRFGFHPDLNSFLCGVGFGGLWQKPGRAFVRPDNGCICGHSSPYWGVIAPTKSSCFFQVKTSSDHL